MIGWVVKSETQVTPPGHPKKLYLSFDSEDRFSTEGAPRRENSREFGRNCARGAIALESQRGVADP